MANAYAARIVRTLAFIARAICSKTSPALRRRRTSAAIILYLATKGTVGLCRLWPSIRAGGHLAARCTASDLPPLNGTSRERFCQRQNQRRSFHSTRKERTRHSLCYECRSRGKTVANGGQEDRCDGADVPHGGLRIDRGQAGPATCSSAMVRRITSAVSLASVHGQVRP